MLEFLTADALAALMKVIMIDLVSWRQRHRDRPGRCWTTGRTAGPGDSDWNCCCDFDAHRLCLRHNTTDVDIWFGTCRRPSVAVGLLENVARVARAGACARTCDRRGLQKRLLNSDGTLALGSPPKKTFLQATWMIIVADVSMSLDNVLAVAGAAREHPWVLIFGLVLSIALMGAAASYIARLLQ